MHKHIALPTHVDSLWSLGCKQCLLYTHESTMQFTSVSFVNDAPHVKARDLDTRETTSKY